MPDYDPVLLEIMKNLLTAVADEMGAALGRTAFSPNIKERRDYSCAVFDPAGAMVAQAAHIPVHLGAMPLSVAAALARWGVTRVCALGQMQNPSLAWRHDGRLSLGDLVTWTDWES